MRTSGHLLLTAAASFIIAAQVLLLHRTATTPDSRIIKAKQPSRPVRLPQAPVLASPSPPSVAEPDPSLPSSDSARSYAIADYTMRAELNPDTHEVRASGVIRWRNLSSYPVAHLSFHLYANAFKSHDSVFFRNARAGWIASAPLRNVGQIDIHKLSVREHGDANLWPRARRAVANEPSDDTDMIIELDRPVPPSSEIHMEVSWTTRLPNIVARMGYEKSFHMVAQWYPKVSKLNSDGRFVSFPYNDLSEYFADFGTYDVMITVPSSFVVGATGERVFEKSDGSRSVVRYVQPHVHDFAFAAWDRFERLTSQIDGVALQVLFPPGYSGAARQQLQVAQFGLRYFGSWLGYYPYRTLTLVHPPHDANAGGMEYPTLITTGGHWLTSTAFGAIRSVTLHELGHQYFQGMVATNENRWPFLDEGLTSFIQARAMDEGWNNGGVLALNKWGLSYAAVLRYAALSAGTQQAIATSTTDFTSGQSYGSLAYSRTATVLETIDRVYDGRLHDALKHYVARYGFAHPEPEDLIESVQQHVGDEAARFLRTSVFDRGTIDVTAKDLHCENKNCSITAIRHGNLHVPVSVQWTCADGSASMTTWNAVTNSEKLFSPVACDVVHVELDPLRKIMLDENFFNNSVSKLPATYPWRSSAMVLFAVNALSAGMLP